MASMIGGKGKDPAAYAKKLEEAEEEPAPEGEEMEAEAVSMDEAKAAAGDALAKALGVSDDRKQALLDAMEAYMAACGHE